LEAAVGKRPEFELYDILKDPACMKNVVNERSCVEVLNKMKKILKDKLKSTKDPRVGNNPEIWETYPRLEGNMRVFPKY
jgi:uncharacterized sulfatase